MAAELAVRIMETADLTDVRKLHSFLEVRYPEPFFEELVAGHGPLDPFSMDSPRVVITVVVTSGASVIGVATARVVRGEHTWGALGDIAQVFCGACGTRERPRGYIMSIIVDPIHRRRGAGGVVLQGLLERVLAENTFGRVQSVELHCLPSNAAARALYRRLGFVETQELPSFYFFDGKYHDALELVLRVAGAGGADP
jgi:ribosomal protein S18 acetylase RimI-like enzyme